MPEPAPASPTRVAVYARCSSDKQDASLERQLAAILPYCDRKGYVVAETYQDDGIAGREFERRPGLMKMLRDAKAGRFDRIVTDDPSRLSRQDVVSFVAKIVHPLAEAGVTLDTVSSGEQSWHDLASLILMTVRSDRSEGEAKELGRRSLAGVLLKAGRGEHVGMTPAYGYKMADDSELGKVPVPDGVKADAVRLMFRMIDEGGTVGGVQDELKARAIAPPKGGTSWGRSSLLRILRNVAYCGTYAYGKCARGVYYSASNGQAKAKARGATGGARPRSEWIAIEDHHEAIVDRATFDRVQARLSGNRKRTTPVKGGGDFLLTGLMACGLCGHNMLGSTPHGRRVYRCGGHLMHGRTFCTLNTVREEDARDLIVDQVERQLLAPARIEAVRAEIRRQEEEEAGPDARGALRQQVADLDGKIRQAYANLAVLPPDMHQGVIVQIRAWEREREEQARQLAAVADRPDRLAELEAHLDALQAGLWRLREALTGGAPAEVRAVLRSLITRVVLNFESVERSKYRRSRLVGGTVNVRIGGVEESASLDMLRGTAGQAATLLALPFTVGPAAPPDDNIAGTGPLPEWMTRPPAVELTLGVGPVYDHASPDVPRAARTRPV